MTAMDHAAAHERIEDLLLEPSRLSALPHSTDPGDLALREHVRGCPVCRADLEAWQKLQHRLAVALPGSAEAASKAVEPIEPPASLRAAVLGAARTASGATSASPSSTPIPIVAPARPRRTFAPWLALAAAIVVLVGAGIVTLDQVGQRSAADAETRALSNAIAAVDRVLAAPDHRVVGLEDAAGVAAGSISWSSQDLVVLTTALEPPPSGKRYLCWLAEGDSGATMIGAMYFVGRTAYWVGSLDEWATFRIGENTRFEVTLQDSTATHFSGPTVLSADLGA